MKKRTIRLLLLAGCSCVLLMVIVAVLIYSPVIFQRGNPVPYLFAASKLDNGTTYTQVDVDDTASVYISHRGTCDELLDYISESKNYALQEQAGSAYLFSNGLDELVVTSEIYLGKYTVWEVPDETISDNQN